MPRTNQSFYAVWSTKSMDCQRFPTKEQALAHVSKVEKQGGVTRLKSFLTFPQMIRWFKDLDAEVLNANQYLAARTKLMDASSAKCLSTEIQQAIEHPLETLLRLQEDTTRPPACIIYVDGAKSNRKKNKDGSKCPPSPAAIGLWSKELEFTEFLQLSELDTHQYAELMAINRGLERMIAYLCSEKQVAFYKVVIVSDSDYAVKMITQWVPRYIRVFGFNAKWFNSSNNEVLHTDLIRRTFLLKLEIEKVLPVEFLWVERKYNSVADAVSHGKEIDPELYTNQKPQ